MSLRVILALVLLATIVSAIGLVHSIHHHRQLFVAHTRLERARDEYNIEFSRLQLEQATWAESNRIEQLARTRLGMKTPEPAEIVVVRP